ncbi:nuclease-related domain-containing protein [Clostridium tagluense]|uniref:nuclease-related domain-containing protein n=1 Tax=Clostridium tagluense TaxID=360422 RepID=UPI001CF0DD13|nr:nuclease-related domain-containing protein [Clostridium tagluense]MCB2300251.1 NERD domain-containing protein [Clostridium tagluense]
MGKIVNVPIFIKDFNKESENVINLNKILNITTDHEMKRKIDNEINLQKYVHDSLGKVYFELKNSPVPFYGLYNIKLEQGDNKSDIDFLMVTNQFCCIINCKSHQGNIEIDSQGSFSRWVKKGEKSIKEGMYSPVEENRKSELILKTIINNQGLEKLPILSLTVFTNPKATLNLKDCAEEMKDKVIKVDLINAKVKSIVQQTTVAVYEEIKVREFAGVLKGLDTSVSNDYRTKFKISHSSENILKVEPKLVVPTLENIKSDEETLVKALKAYWKKIRLSQKMKTMLSLLYSISKAYILYSKCLKTNQWKRAM